MNDTRSDDEIQITAKNLFIGSAPERHRELEALWAELDLKFYLAPDIHDGDRIIFQGGRYREVWYNHRATRAFWMAAFVAWEGYRANAESTDPAQIDLTRFGELLDHFDEMILADAADECPMPFGIPEPGTFVEKQDNAPYRAAAELATIALGWAFLHEVRHIRHQREFTSAPSDGSDPSLSRGEEISCDEYATDFLIDRVDDYAKAEGVAPESVRLKRELAIYFAFFAITLLAKGNWQQSDSHPAVQDRINAIVARFGEQKEERAFAMAHAAFLALNQKWHGAPSVGPSK